MRKARECDKKRGEGGGLVRTERERCEGKEKMCMCEREKRREMRVVEGLNARKGCLLVCDCDSDFQSVPSLPCTQPMRSATGTHREREKPG